MRRLLPLAAALLFVLAPAARPEGKDAPEGFEPLFNGKDLDGWKVFGGDMEKWGAADGVLFTKGGGGGWLLTEKEYGDFELRLEYKVPEHGNSGVALRAPLEGNVSYSGMEIQIIDDEHWPGLKEWQHTGSVYGVVPAAKQANKPIGEWNKMRIVAKGRMVLVELNGVKLVDADLDKYKEEHAKEHPGIVRDKGHLGVQSHDGRVEFRNLFVKPL
jgi:hypothetical protein